MAVLVLTATRAVGLEVGVKSVGEDMIIILVMGGENRSYVCRKDFQQNFQQQYHLPTTL